MKQPIKTIIAVLKQIERAAKERWKAVDRKAVAGKDSHSKHKKFLRESLLNFNRLRNKRK